MIYLYGWNSVSEFILDELEGDGFSIDGVIVDDQYIDTLIYPEVLNVIPASKVRLNTEDWVYNCIGYKNLQRRIQLGDRLIGLGVLKKFVSKRAVIHDAVTIDEGVVLLGDVVIERNSHIGKHCLLWGGSRICHHSVLGHGVFLAAGSIVGGACAVGDMCSLGFNSSLREKCQLPAGTKVGANRFWRPQI